jgi:peptidoglycan hydrolase-like protein with peptidoglycan-binding domain
MPTATYRPPASRARRLTPWLVVFAVTAAPAAGLWALAWNVDDTPSELRVTPAPVFAEATLRVRDGVVNIFAEVEIHDGPALVSPGWDGVVTSIDVSAGDVLVSGIPVLSVDRVAREAVATDMPFHRELTLGARGGDVQELERFLASLELLGEEPDEIFTSSTAAAVKAYEAQVGVARPTGVFSPSLVVWLPEEPMTVSSMLVTAGDLAPGAGSAVVSTEPTVLSARLVRGDGSPFDFDGERVLEVEEREVGVVVGGSVVPESVAQGIWDASRTLAPVGEAAGVVLVSVTLRLPEPEEVWTLPSSAVMVDKEGVSTCVWVDDGEALAPVDVTPVGGTLGATDLNGSLAGRVVLINPVEFLADPSCP